MSSESLDVNMAAEHEVHVCVCVCTSSGRKCPALRCWVKKRKAFGGGERRRRTFQDKNEEVEVLPQRRGLRACACVRRRKKRDAVASFALSVTRCGLQSALIDA